MRKFLICMLGVVSGIVLLTSGNAFAAVVTLDLTSDNSGSINGAQFWSIYPKGTGTGVIDAFVEIGANTDVIRAYNTIVDGVLDNTNTDQFNHELLLSSVPIVTLEDGINYREFLLDINQQGNHPYLTVDEIQVFRSSTANQSKETFTGGIVDITGGLVYQMDAGGNSTILLDFNHGSGSGDMFTYIPDSLFSSKTGDYVYLYSQLGGDSFKGVAYPNNDGHEEWAVQKGATTNPPVPEPATMSLLGLGLLGLVGFRRKKASN